MASNKAGVLGAVGGASAALGLIAAIILGSDANAGPMSKIDQNIKDKAAEALKADLTPLVDAQKAAISAAGGAAKAARAAETKLQDVTKDGSVTVGTPEYDALVEDWMAKKSVAEKEAVKVALAKRALRAKHEQLQNDIQALVSERCAKDDGSNALIVELCAKRQQAENPDGN